MTTFSKNDIEKLTAKGRIDSKSDFNLLFRSHYTLFLSFACRYSLNREEARDIVQDVFAAFWEQRDNYDSLPAIKAFFYRSIANRCLNYLKHEDVKSRYAENRMEEMENEEFIQENIIREEVSFIVRRKIKELSPREREVILLALQNKSNQEIADRLAISLPTVKTHKMHAYARLRMELAELRYILPFLLSL